MSASACFVCGRDSNERDCVSCTVRIKRYRQKLAALEMLGHSCFRCGWNGHQSALDFHHKFDKKFGVANFIDQSWDTLKPELSKCEVLCVICHRLESVRDKSAAEIEAVLADYQRIVKVFHTPYQKFEVAGINAETFKSIEGLTYGPRESLTPEEISFIEAKFGESPYRYLCFPEDGKSACSRESDWEKTEKIEGVTCRDCLVALAKRAVVNNAH